MDKTLEYYRHLPYTIRTQPEKDSDGTDYWTAEYIELRGCKTDGSSEAEAIKNVQDLFDEHITIRLSKGTLIPEPEKEGFELQPLMKMPPLLEILQITAGMTMTESPKKEIFPPKLQPSVKVTGGTRGTLSPKTIPADYHELVSP